MKREVIIVGAGASGLTAAIFAAAGNDQVTVLEHGQRAGKKILSTGNGKCNMTNLHLDSLCYRSSQVDFPMKAIEAFGVDQVLDFFKRLGIVTKERNGYVYPASEQAASVLEALLLEAQRLHVHMVFDCETQSIKKKGDLFELETSQGRFQAHKLILATGSQAAPKTGSDGSGYRLAQAFGHKIVKPLPALVALRCKEKWYTQLAGVRTEAQVTIFINGQPVMADRGELQLTDYGISGIPVFQVSRYAVKALHQGKEVKAHLDFYPRLEASLLLSMLEQRRQLLGYRQATGFLTGFFPHKISLVCMKLSGITPDSRVTSITDKQLEQLCGHLKGLVTQVTGHNTFDQAQICQGGVDVSQVDPTRFESRLVKGLYLVGELLDVDGICGGYNLQWAFSSGALAGKDQKQ